MLDPKFFDEMAARLRQVLPESIHSVPAELEKNLKAVLQAGFAKLDVVTRDEFDVQVAALKKAQAKLNELEQSLAALNK